MIIICIADIHGNVGMLKTAKKYFAGPDILLVAGDLTNMGMPFTIGNVIAELKDICPAVYAIPGNCDGHTVNKALNDANISLDRNVITTENIQFIGIGGVSATGAELADSDPFDRFLNQNSHNINKNNPIVLLTHQPAYGCKLDISKHGKHMGSPAIRQFIENTQPILAVSGHCHESLAVDKINNTTLINPGPLRAGNYARVEMDPKKAEVTNAQLLSLNG